MAQDYTAQAQNDVNNQGAALLQAIADQGTRGAAAFQAAQQQAAAQKQDAIAGVLNRSTLGDGSEAAPQALVNQLQAQAVQPGQQQQADLLHAQDYYNQDLGRMSAANQNYMSQMAAAVPIVQARTQAQADLIKQQNDQKAADQALQLQLAQLQVQQGQAALANTQAAGVRDANAANTQAKQQSVAQQKYDQQQADQQRQNDLEAWAQGMGNSTGRAFLDGVANSKNLPEALNALDEAIATINPNYKGDPYSTSDPQSAFFAKYGTDVDISQLRQMLTAYYNGTPAPPTSGSVSPVHIF